MYLIISIIVPIEIKAQPLLQSFYNAPLDIPLKLSGNYGDIRGGTYHFGIDFRTNETIGFPVYCIADGYIARIKIEPGGYGRALYVNHTNGTTSVYAHLSNLNDSLNQFIKQEQYKNESFYTDFTLKPDQLQVKQCQIIGYTGNAGMSSGPHLHFEIRDTKSQNTLNCLLPDFMMVDTLKPIFKSLWIYPQINYLTESTIATDNYSVVAKNGSFQLITDSVINVPDKFGIGLEAFDNLTDTTRKLSFFSSQMFIDTVKWFEMTFDEISFDEVGYVYSCIDYEQKITKNKNIYKHFTLENQSQFIYKKAINKGFVHLTDTNIHTITCLLNDFSGNQSVFKFRIKLSSKKTQYLTVKDSLSGYQLFWNKKNEIVFMGTKIHFPLNSLYSDACISIDTFNTKNKNTSSPIKIGETNVPLKKAFSISFPVNNFSDSLKKKLVVLSIAPNGMSSSIGGIIENGYLVAHTKSFGVYAIGIDNTPPKIKPVNISSSKNMKSEKNICIKTDDDISGIAHYRGTIDNKWVLFEYDLKSDLLCYTFDSARFIPNNKKHKLKLVVTDKRGNINTYSTNFIK
jgi:murein DD-endopeptidase MepM/ murein hydrolase activator NlpD